MEKLLKFIRMSQMYCHIFMVYSVFAFGLWYLMSHLATCICSVKDMVLYK